MPDLEKHVKKFKEEINNENFRIKKFDIDDNEMFKLALKLGYKDAQRTFTNINQLVWQKHTDAKERFHNVFSEEIQKVFKKEVEFSPEALFDNLSKFFQGYGYKVTYGQAQKVINMSFKYLYCLDTEKEYKYIFDKCHMPLDSYTLEWYKRHIYPIDKNKDFKITSDDKWSSLDSKKYIAITQDIKKHSNKLTIKINGELIKLPATPLEAEFIIWQEEIMNQNVANFNKAINKKYQKKDDYREMLIDTENYIRKLKE